MANGTMEIMMVHSTHRQPSSPLTWGHSDLKESAALSVAFEVLGTLLVFFATHFPRFSGGGASLRFSSGRNDAAVLAGYASYLPQPFRALRRQEQTSELLRGRHNHA